MIFRPRHWMEKEELLADFRGKVLLVQYGEQMRVYAPI